MFKQATSIAGRLRARTISAPIARPLPLNFEAPKSQAPRCEPALPLPEHTPQERSTHHQHDPVPQMLTFSTFDPCASRPLLMSGLSLGPENWHREQSNDNTSPSETERVVRERKSVKPWPYSLPKFLQPQPGTTYQLMYDHSASGATRRVGVLQALLYGVPDPGHAGVSGGEEREFVRKVLDGIGQDE
jgi:hypothetical protein